MYKAILTAPNGEGKKDSTVPLPGFWGHHRKGRTQISQTQTISP